MGNGQSARAEEGTAIEDSMHNSCGWCQSFLLERTRGLKPAACHPRR
jgi:hypothetical protein